MKTLKSKKVLGGIALVMGCLNPAQAGYTILGQSDCGEWVTESKTSASVRAWVLGFMSGLSAMHNLNDRTGDPMSKINSAQQIYVWMDNFCQKNPLKTVNSGGIELFIELIKK